MTRRRRGCQHLEGTGQSDVAWLRHGSPSYLEARRRARTWLSQQPDRQHINAEWHAQIGVLTDRYDDADAIPEDVLDDAIDRIECGVDIEERFRLKVDALLLEIWDEEDHTDV